ncbi:phosphatidylinositol 3,4,5-trisphosphate 3-phosphatase TPTE2-like isoform X1 [Pan troglodytes]|uniref:phosphatidylinositol 3,4,5-trisphosphate 3-phosphatase TPTE2-like isoform X1 n=1 Tax=Pan troglodytes TaxID=9598 RepID=UPI003013236C
MKNVFMDTFTLLSVQILISVTELKGVKKLRMEVVQFLDKKHPNHYQVYNLCSERAYDPKHFHIRVSRIMMDDHYVPTLHKMVVFSKEVNEWMTQDPENVVVIHCKGGKETGSCCVAQTGLELLDSSDPPTSASQSAGIIGIS